MSYALFEKVQFFALIQGALVTVIYSLVLLGLFHKNFSNYYVFLTIFFLKKRAHEWLYVMNLGLLMH